MAMTFEEFITNIDRVLELDKVIDKHHDPEERALMNEEFVTKFTACFKMGSTILERQELSPKAREVLLKQMGKLNSVINRYEAQKKLRTANEVKSGKTRDDAEEVSKGRAA